VRLLLDAVSSFGGEEIDFEKWEIDACAGTSYTCLHGVPGVSFVIARKSAFSRRKTAASGVYLDLFRQYAEQSRNATPFTPAVSLYFALNEALEELLDAGGWRSRRAHYRDLTQRLFHGLRAQGIEPLLDIREPASSHLTSYRIPGGSDYSSMHSYLKKAGFVIYAGQGKLAGEMFRIATMGALTSRDIDQLLRAFEEYWSTRVKPQQELPTLNLPPRKLQ
jgi:2-aminoethylphosphonate-pyruvate transaminase